MALTNRTLILFKYLWETTDEAHPVSLADISAHLKEYGITADPRTLRRDIEQLVEFGVDIVKDRRVQNLYHVASRHFEAPEVKLLIDAVQSARFITPKKSKDLVKRLTAFAAPGDAALLKRHLYIDSRVKAANENVYISVDRIQAAIAERKKITFRYFTPDERAVLAADGQNGTHGGELRHVAGIERARDLHGCRVAHGEDRSTLLAPAALRDADVANRSVVQSADLQAAAAVRLLDELTAAELGLEAQLRRAEVALQLAHLSLLETQLLLQITVARSGAT